MPILNLPTDIGDYIVKLKEIFFTQSYWFYTKIGNLITRWKLF